MPFTALICALMADHMASLQPHRRHLPINAKKWQEPFDGSPPTIQDIKKEDVPVLTHPLFLILFGATGDQIFSQFWLHIEIMFIFAGN